MHQEYLFCFGAFKISYYFWSGHDVASLFLADNPYEMELLIKQKLDCFAFFCETVRVNNKLFEKMLKIINIELLKNYFFEKMTVKDLLTKKWSPQFLYRQTSSLSPAPSKVMITSKKCVRTWRMKFKQQPNVSMVVYKIYKSGRTKTLLS